MHAVRRFFAGFTELGLLLIVLSFVAAIVFGNDIPFVGAITGNLLAVIKQLGDAGLAGLIAVGILAWLLAKRP
ncbi:MAG: hypothetical protein CMM10_09660 [Rhodospirillaceae bacterium]|jgi:hypothetical protein|nr:hypothetical protein [Rhodospirillaceae bacterium]MDP6644289.1 hypothetical protein [Rhodospirillales bacterium]|tara:strand:+ start:296 stop:514 length:219 start_codon:yes stop_codon:yes gene_type:complete